MSNSLKLIVCIGVCELVGILGGLLTRGAIPNWYETLNQPSFRPPNWVFGPVWTALYALMGIAAFLIWRTGLDRPGVKTALVVFIVQLVLNGIWTPLFFGLRSPIAGLVDIVLLWAAIVVTIILFFRLSTGAGLLLLPYLAWVSFAAVLNYFLWRMNRGG